MSPREWGTCPRCQRDARTLLAQRMKDAEKAYGKVPIAEFDLLRAEADKSIDVGETLRENYQIGVSDDGSFCVSYSCSCKCGFKFEFNCEKKGLLAKYPYREPMT